MEESKKKPIMIGAIVVCLVVAGVVTIKTRRPKGSDLRPFADKSTWVLCRNPECKASYEMNLKEYFEFIEANQDPRSLAAPPLTCTECGEPSVYRAVKCGNADCGFVFERGAVVGDFADRCPKCKYSQTELDRKARLAERQAK
jgi:hypothetical protein